MFPGSERRLRFFLTANFTLSELLFLVSPTCDDHIWSFPSAMTLHCFNHKGGKRLVFFSHLRAKRSIKNAYPLSIISIIESWLNVQKGFSKCNIQNAIMVISLLLIYNDKRFLEYPIREKKINNKIYISHVHFLAENWTGCECLILFATVILPSWKCPSAEQDAD